MKFLNYYINTFKGLSREAWMLSIVMLINRSGSMVLPFLGVYMTDHLKFSLENAGIVLSFYGIGSVVGSWLGGYLTDKFGEYYIQTWSLFLSAPIFLIIPFFPSVEMMAVLIFLQSTISDTFRPANSVAITKYARPENLTKAFSLNRMAINLGFSIGPALGGILSGISYNFLFVVNFIGAVIAGIIYVIFFRKRNKIFRERKKSETAQVIKKAGKSPYKDYPFLLYSFLCTVFAICFFQFFNTIPLFYKDVAKLSQSTIGFILGYSGFIIVLLEMPLVSIAERTMKISQILFAGVFLAGLSYLMLIFGSNIPWLIIAMTVLCVAEIWALPFMSTVTALRSENGNKGAYMGVNGIAFSFSFIITPFLGTYVVSRFGFDSLWIGSFSVLAISAVLLYIVVKKMLPAK
ncbi:MDR family MFS transporter [Epilithonimonas arachidiradicis]|uniref:MFS transporter n=1 Tax=Epilithonimonas arachidiradicis TaxID=1617282 RepID=A0A420DA08_9FLAO|nr:MFS transporter [Epilithonimonas arachidiradicis]RKE87586.1 putative MFS family arabinose efflux permease [Epilithonimonas arachidiradicis]GGG56357.1 MFS transporter [Epilithonimonas arachidiradicis]